MFVKFQCKNVFFINYFWWFQGLIIGGIIYTEKYQNRILPLDILFIFFEKYLNVKLWRSNKQLQNNSK